MNYSKYIVSLDVREPNSNVCLNAKKGDTSRTIFVNLTDGGFPYHITDDCYAAFTALKPDGNVLFNECSIEDCVIRYDFTDQTVSAVGLMRCEVILYGGDGKQLTSAGFSIIVGDTVYDTETEVESTSEFNALAELIAKVNGLDFVKTVNGKGPDENGNVDVEVGGGSGEPCYSPTVNLKETADGVQISVTDVNGTHEAFIHNGKDGETPVKGVDYFTPEEIHGIAEQASKMVDVPEGGGVTSWNDLTDKPFYTGDPVETEVFNLSTALFQDDEPVWEQLMPIDDTTYLWVSHPETLEQVFEVGKEYTVVIDGVEHKTTAIDSAVLLGEVGPEVGLGDIEFLLSDTLPDSFQYAIHEIDDYGYPYFHIWYKGETAPTEFKVLGIKPEIVKIDPKYLPDGGVGYVTEGEYGVLRECTVEITGIGDDVWGDEHKLLSRNLVLAAGETYRVTVNGVAYERVAYYDPDDATIILVGGDSDPFKLQNQHGWIYFYPEENGTYTVKLEGKPAPVYHKIDPRFLPDDIVTGEDLDNVLEEVRTMIDAAGGGLSRDEVQTMIDEALSSIPNAEEARF